MDAYNIIRWKPTRLATRPSPRLATVPAQRSRHSVLDDVATVSAWASMLLAALVTEAVGRDAVGLTAIAKVERAVGVRKKVVQTCVQLTIINGGIQRIGNNLKFAAYDRYK